MQQEAVVEGGIEPRDSCGMIIGWVGLRHSPADHDLAVIPTSKHWVTLLCDYSGVKDPTHESLKALDAIEVMKLVGGFVSSRTVVATECAVEAFLATYRPNLVSHHGSFSFRRSKVVG